MVVHTFPSRSCTIFRTLAILCLLEMNATFEGDEDWDVELIQDLVRKEEEAIAAKRATQISSCSNVNNACDFSTILASNTKNLNAGEASLGAYMYSFSPLRGFNDGNARLYSGKTEGLHTAFDNSSAILGHPSKQPREENRKPEPSIQVNRNVELLQRELECLSEQLLFQDQEKLELYRERDEKEEQLRRALEAVAAKDAEIESLKKMRQTEGSRERQQTYDARDTSRAYRAENCGNPDLANNAVLEVSMLGTANGISNNYDAWSPPWTTKRTRKEAIGVDARVLAATPKNLCRESNFRKIEGFDVKDDQIGTSSAAELRARVLIEHASSRRHDSNPSQAQELLCRETTALPRSGRTRGTITDSYQDVQSCERDKSFGLRNPSHKLCAIWDPTNNKRWGTNLVSKLFVSCGVDLYILLGSTCGSLKDNNDTKLKDMLCGELSEGGHAIHAAEDGEAEKMHLLSQNLYFILAKLINAMAPMEALMETLLGFCTLANVKIVQSALRVLNCTLHDECYLKREDHGRGHFPQGIPKSTSRLLNSFGTKCSPKTDDEMLRLQDCSQLPSSGKFHVDNDVALFPYVFSSRIHHRNTELVDGDRDANNKPIANQTSYKKQIVTRNQVSHDPHIVKWPTLFRIMHQIALENESMDVKLQAISLMNLIVMKSNPNVEREKFGPIVFYRSLSQLLRKKVGLNVQLQAVRLLFLLLNCPRLFKLFCGCKEDVRNHTENSDVYIDITEIEGRYEMVLEGLAECISCTGNGLQEYTLRRHALHVLAFIAASGSMGVASLLSFMHSSSKDAQEQIIGNHPRKYDGPTIDGNVQSHNPDTGNEKALHSPKNSKDVDQQMLNIPMSLVALLNSELDAEEAEDVALDIGAETPSKERTTLIQEALILLHGLASHSMYSAPILEVLTKDKVASRLSLGVVNRIISKTLHYHRIKRFQKTHSNQVDIIELARVLQQKILPYVTDL